MQGSFLLDVGQGPNSQEANEHLQHLLHLRFEKHTLELQTKTEALFDYTPVSMHATTQMDQFNIRNTSFSVPETPATGATELVCVTLPTQALDI